MKIILVWLMIARFDGYKSESSIVVDNIATKESCVTLSEQVTKQGRALYAQCIQISKVQGNSR